MTIIAITTTQEMHDVNGIIAPSCYQQRRPDGSHLQRRCPLRRRSDTKDVKRLMLPLQTCVTKRRTTNSQQAMDLRICLTRPVRTIVALLKMSTTLRPERNDRRQFSRPVQALTTPLTHLTHSRPSSCRRRSLPHL